QSVGANGTLINTGDDSATRSTSVTRNVDLTVTKSASAASVVAGSGSGNLSYVVTVTNNGPSDSASVVLSEATTLEAGVTVDSVTPSAGSFSGNNGTGTWSVGPLASGASATLTLVLTVGHSAAVGTNVISDTAGVQSIAANESLINTGDDS